MAEDFKFAATLDALKSDLQQSIRQRDELDKKIAGLKQSIMGLMALRDASIEDTEPSEAFTPIPSFNDLLADLKGLPGPTTGLTDLCRAALKASGKPMTAPEVRHEVELMGFDFSEYDSNPLSSIHAILRRIPEVSYKKLDGKTVYEWKGLSGATPKIGPLMPPPGYVPPKNPGTEKFVAEVEAMAKKHPLKKRYGAENSIASQIAKRMMKTKDEK